jgi:hypothetical protein
MPTVLVKPSDRARRDTASASSIANPGRIANPGAQHRINRHSEFGMLGQLFQFAVRCG